MSFAETLHHSLTGSAPCMKRLKHDVGVIAALDSSVLLGGETGAGKGRTARRIHALSKRAGEPFVHVDCAALTGSLIETELFGHERGAFTGADQQHVGRFERAAGGTIFLDEIGDLDWTLQAKLLRVLEDREYERVGGTHTLRMRARVIAASSRRLFPAQGDRVFRTDLYFRLSVFQLEIPPLRERPEDLAALVAGGLDDLCSQHGWTRPVVTPSFLKRLARHDWPGNVRELMNTLERVVSRRQGEQLVAADVDDALATMTRPGSAPHTEPRVAEGGLRSEVAELERREILEALASAGGNVSEAARRLHLPRGTLRHKLRKLSIEDVASAAATRLDGER